MEAAPSRACCCTTRTAVWSRIPGWPGEYLLNTATAHSRAGLAKIEDRWLDGCKRKGFDAIEPDNLDSNTRSHHLLTRADNFAFAQLLISPRSRRRARHRPEELGRAEQARRTRPGFDFAIAEECQVYNECGHYTEVPTATRSSRSSTPTTARRTRTGVRGARRPDLGHPARPQRHPARLEALPLRGLLTVGRAALMPHQLIAGVGDRQACRDGSASDPRRRSSRRSPVPGSIAGRRTSNSSPPVGIDHLAHQHRRVGQWLQPDAANPAHATVTFSRDRDLTDRISDHAGRSRRTAVARGGGRRSRIAQPGRVDQ